MKDIKDLISIIVPVHNSNQFVNNIVNNVKKQTYKNWELIIVDDHSTDKTVESLKKKLNHIEQDWKLCMNTGNGVSSARNLGIILSRGKYIAFIDDDDELTKDYLEDLYRNAKKYSSQLTFVNYVECYDNKRIYIKLPWSGLYDSVFKIKAEIIPRLVYPKNDENEVWLPVWRTLIERDFLKKSGITFNEKISQAEDFIFIFQLILKSKKIYFDNGPGKYFYKRRPNSSMNKYISNDLAMQLINNEDLYNILYRQKLYTIVKKRYISRRINMYSTAISNAVRINNIKISINLIRNIRLKLLKDRFLYNIKWGEIYNPFKIKVAIIMLKMNLIIPLYFIYFYKERKRLSKL